MDGVRACSLFLLSDGRRQSVSAKAPDEATWMAKSGGKLDNILMTENKKRDGSDNCSWAAHPEGHHAHLSGMHFVRALQTDTGAAGAALVSDDLAAWLPQLLACDGRSTLPGEALNSLLVMCEGRLPLQVDTNGQTKMARGYNAMDFARWIVVWAETTGRCKPAAISSETFDILQKAQGAVAKAAHDKMGITNAAEFNSKMRVLARVGRPCMPPPDWVQCQGPSWPCVFVHICEYAQVDRDHSQFALREVTGADPGILRDTVRACILELASGSLINHRKCHTGMVIEAAEGALARPLPLIRLRSKQECPRHLKKPKMAEAALFGSKCRRKAGGKDPAIKRRKIGGQTAQEDDPLRAPMICPRCQSVVRKDVLARHQGTAKCRRICRATL